MRAIIFLIHFNFLLLTFCKNTNSSIPEITNERLGELINELRTGEYKDAHKYLLKLVLHPEDADLNKDRKISPNELKKSLNWLIMPKNNEVLQSLHSDVIEKTMAGIELFINNINEHLNYKQFQELLSRIKIENILNLERMKKNVEAKNLGIDLYDDL